MNHATITFSSPVEHTSYDQGDTVQVAGMAIAEEDLHGYDLYILNKTSGDTVFSFKEHAHSDTLDIMHQWIVDVVEQSDMELGIVVTLDHDENKQVQTLEFHCIP